VHGVRAARPSQALHALGDGAAGNEHELLAGLAELRDLACPPRDRRGVEARTAVGDERASDLDDETPGFAHAALPVSRNLITDEVSSRQPSPVSAEMRKRGPRQRSLRTRSSSAALPHHRREHIDFIEHQPAGLLVEPRIELLQLRGDRPGVADGVGAFLGRRRVDDVQEQPGPGQVP